MSHQIKTRTRPVFMAFLMVLFGALLLSGCGSRMLQLKVTHDAIKAPPAKGSGTVLVKPFIDARDDKTIIGNRRGGFGQVVGTVGTQKDVELMPLLTGFFAESLEQAGYTAKLESKGETGPVDLVLEGTVKKFWLDTYMAVWHVVMVNLKAKDPVTQNVVWSKDIETKEGNVLWIGATGEYERIIRLATTKALNEATTAFGSDEFRNAVKGNK